MHLLNRRHDEALAECYRAVQLRPNCLSANCYLASILHYCGRSDEAVARVEEAIRITPVDPPSYMTVLGGCVPRQRRFGRGARRGRARDQDEPARPRPEDRSLQRLQPGWPAAAGSSNRREVVTAEPAFSIRSYVESQAYQDAATLQRLSESLRQPGLPESGALAASTAPAGPRLRPANHQR